MLFSDFDYYDLRELRFSGEFLLQNYKALKNDGEINLPTFATTVFTTGMNGKDRYAELLLSESFPDLISLAKRSKIDDRNWKIIPKHDHDEEVNEDNGSDPYGFKRFWGVTKRKHGSAPSWDYCEILLRTLVTTFVERNYSRQVFLDSFKDYQTFERGFEYCVSYKAGLSFVGELLKDLRSGKVKLAAHHLKVFQRR
jgi:hypothetical protein